MFLRMGGHLSLSGHFLILAALYLALRPGLQKRRLAWGVLLAVTALVHAYLLAMVALIWLADLASQAIKGRLSRRDALIELGGLFFCWLRSAAGRRVISAWAAGPWRAVMGCIA
nr:hypothetical protein GCM10020185_12270 [Pseudomonas brassicacearum subsp. brassicacearum]